MTPDYVNKILHGDWIEQLQALPSAIFHCCVTSPPYWGQRNYGVAGQLGLERTPEEHIEKLVVGFREVRRVLRDDGSLFVNYGDKYAGSKSTSGGYSDTSTLAGFTGEHTKGRQMNRSEAGHSIETNVSSGNLLLLPARVALALQADGWILRQDNIWAKALSLCPTYSGSTMPESISGTRWERHRVKMKKAAQTFHGAGQAQISGGQRTPDASGGVVNADHAQWADCPGCKVCEPNGGYVLRRGSGRCTKAHEHVFQFAKGPGYFWDQEAIKEPNLTAPHASGYKNGVDYASGPMNRGGHSQREDPQRIWASSGRNPRDVWAVPEDLWSIFLQWYAGQSQALKDVWCINPKAYKGSHYATFPPKLVEVCIRAATSAKGVCPKCGAPWARIIEKPKPPLSVGSNPSNFGGKGDIRMGGGQARQNWLDENPSRTLGWKATCRCEAGEPVPALVLDPFFGSGCTGMVAAQLGRNYTGIELSKDYIYEQAQWRVKEGETGMKRQEAVIQGALFT